MKNVVDNIIAALDDMDFGKPIKRDSQEEGQADRSIGYGETNRNVKVYPDTPDIRKLLTKESPLQVLSEDFPRQEWPIRGGWGYSKADAVIIDMDDDRLAVHFEYQFLEYRCYEEAIVFRPKGQHLAGFDFQRGMQFLHVDKESGRAYDEVIMHVTAYTEQDYHTLQSDWEQHQSYQDDEEGRERHHQRAESMKIKYDVTAWFDITRSFRRTI